jgi:hypothetical protein
MPGMDKTGPLGTGPIGRCLGPCSGGKAGWGRGSAFGGRGFRRGGRAGWGTMPDALSPDEEKALLEQKQGWLKMQLESISQRLQGLDKSRENTAE